MQSVKAAIRRVCGIDAEPEVFFAVVSDRFELASIGAGLPPLIQHNDKHSARAAARFSLKYDLE